MNVLQSCLGAVLKTSCNQHGIKRGQNRQNGLLGSTKDECDNCHDRDNYSEISCYVPGDNIDT